MGRDPKRLDPEHPDKVLQFEDLTVKFYETTDRRGAKQAAVWIQRNYTSAGPAETLEFKADLDRLEAVVDYGNDLKTRLKREPGRAQNEFGSKAREHVLELGSWTVSYHEQEDPAGKSRVVVELDQYFLGPKGGEYKQCFSCDLRQLDQVAKWGIAFENQRGHERKSYPVVKIESLAEEGWVRARVVRWDEKEAAQRYADENRNHGYGLCEKPSRWRYEFSLTLKETDIPSLSAEIRFLKAELARVGPGLLLGIWYQKGQEPHEGMPVKFIGGRDPTSREPIDYRIIPAGVQTPQGPNEDPISIIVDVDRKNHPPIHRILEVIRDSERAKARFQELKIERLRHEQDLDLSRANMPRGHRH